ncbi:MAG: peptidase inhibitor family I36 protein [Cyanobacteria bacterium]|nr:peptidase inhibitor family I36 protein [Cyanobacteriota bacterium]
MAAHSRASGLVLVVALAALAGGCTPPELPMAPSPLTTGVILYEHANFLGNSAHLTADVSDLRDFRGPCSQSNGDSTRDWNDCASSVRVAPGWRATLYRGTSFRDDALEITSDVANLQLAREHDCDKGGLNDCVSSVRVRPQ